jgi:beta-lactamase regulating signal transducer with metallopeptidase domain
MDHLLLSVSPLSAAVAGALFSAIWEGGVLAACVAVCLRLLPGLSAAARSLVWTNVFLLLMLLHVLPFAGGRMSIGRALPHPLFHLNLLWSAVIAGVWTMLSLWRGTQLALGAIRLRGLERRATPVHADGALQALLEVRDENGKGGRRAELCISAEVERPSVFGFLHPRVLFPSALLEQLTAQELRQVLLHEVEHLRRGDDWTNLLQKIGLVLFPLNPALLWVECRLCAERELACDDCVLHATGARKAYAVCLTRLAEYAILRRNVSLALGVWERQSELAGRVHRILRPPTQSMSGRQAMVLTSGLLLGVAAGAMVLARSPQLVSFSPLARPLLEARSMAAPDLAGINLRGFSGSPVLVKAVMPQRPYQPSRLSNRRSASAARAIARARQPLPSQPDLVVLTEWEEVQTPAHVVIAVARINRSSHAAVALENGWLIVQI